MHVLSFFVLLLKIHTSQKCTGISLKTQLLYCLVFATRYLDIFWNFLSLYNSVMKVLFLASSFWIVYLMKYKRPICGSYDPSVDDFPILYLIVPCFIVGVLIHAGQVYFYEDPFSVFEVASFRCSVFDLAVIVF